VDEARAQKRVPGTIHITRGGFVIGGRAVEKGGCNSSGPACMQVIKSGRPKAEEKVEQGEEKVRKISKREK